MFVWQHGVVLQSKDCVCAAVYTCASCDQSGDEMDYTQYANMRRGWLYQRVVSMTVCENTRMVSAVSPPSSTERPRSVPQQDSCPLRRSAKLATCAWKWRHLTSE